MRLELQHVSVPMPSGGHEAARAFYGGLLGLEERDVPPKLDPSELVWFRAGQDLELHVFESGESAPRGQHSSACGSTRAWRSCGHASSPRESRSRTRRRSSAARASCAATRSATASS
jgi:hypothetical protein